MDGTNQSGIEPLEYNVLVRPKDVDKKTAGGLIIPEREHERMQWAEVRGVVVCVSKDAFDSFRSSANPGDEVIFARHVGMTTKGSDGVDYKLIKDKDILAVVRHD